MGFLKAPSNEKSHFIFRKKNSKYKQINLKWFDILSTNQFENYKRCLMSSFSSSIKCYISTFNRHLCIQSYLNTLINNDREYILKI